jgi:hypothetical protein
VIGAYLEAERINEAVERVVSRWDEIFRPSRSGLRIWR